MEKSEKHPAVHSELIPIINVDDSRDFVALSCYINDDGFCEHSGIIICFQEELWYFHFGGKDAELKNITSEIESMDSLFFKELNIIKEEEVVTFLGHCEKLKAKGVSPLYGFIFNDSYYDSNTKESYLQNTTYDITTCVGFCIKVVRGFLHNNPEYLKLEDWDIDTLKDAPKNAVNYMQYYLSIFAAKNKISYQELFDQSELKRILPSELLTSGFFTELPISKESISQICPSIEDFFIKLKAA